MPIPEIYFTNKVDYQNRNDLEYLRKPFKVTLHVIQDEQQKTNALSDEQRVLSGIIENYN